MELAIKNLSKNYGDKQALTNVDLTLQEGIYGFLGPNGAGKSTMMNIITGNIPPTSGSVYYDGEDVFQMGARFRSKLGYMPQQQALYPTFTANRFLSYVAALRGMTKPRAQERIPYVLELVGLSDVARKRIGSFSGGMKQRLLIAQAILDDPEILILDEPTAGLDPKQRIIIRNLIASIAMHKIVILATHVVSDVEFIARQIVMLEGGHILRNCPREALIEELQGKVFEVHIAESELETVQQQYRVSNITSGADGIYVRVLHEEAPSGLDCQPVRPTLEDVYLWLCEE
jgi:ABC-type multidrug transport system ATPase subunit